MSIEGVYLIALLYAIGLAWVFYIEFKKMTFKGGRS